MYCKAQLDTSAGKGWFVVSDARVSVGQNESVTVEPLGVLRAEVHVSGPEDVSGRSHTLAVSAARKRGGEGLPSAHPGDQSWPGMLVRFVYVERDIYLADDIRSERSDGAGGLVRCDAKKHVRPT